MSREKQVDEILSSAYYDLESGVGFAGLSALQRYGKQQGILPSETKKWLMKQKHYKKFKPQRKTIKRRSTYVDGLDEQWQADLIDVQKYSRWNRGYRYILICIDILSRYVWATPLKSKDYMDVLQGFKKIVSGTERKPLVLQTDQGTEFVGVHFQSFLKHLGVRHFYTSQSTKSSIVERVIRTIMGKIWQAMENRGAEKKWTDLLPKAVKGYNNSFHRSIGVAPNKVSVNNSQEVWRYLFRGGKKKQPKESDQPIITIDSAKAVVKKKKKIKPAFSVGDKVWIYDKKASKNAFQKGYKSKWLTDQVFTIHLVNDKTRPFTYRLHNAEGKLVPGQFYKEQLQKIPEE